MVRYGKKQWDDDYDNMKAHRVERKYRGHKLAVAVGHHKLLRAAHAPNPASLSKKPRSA